MSDNVGTSENDPGTDSNTTSRGEIVKKKAEQLKNEASRLMNGVAHSWSSFAYGSWRSHLDGSRNADMWLLGKSFDASKRDYFEADLKSRIFFSYRSKFPLLIEDRKDTGSDVGWGCMIRTSQMLLAHTLTVQNLGRDTGLDWVREDATPSSLYNIIRLFEDCKTSPLGIHNFINQAAINEIENPVGRWYSPSEVFIIFRELIKKSHNCLLSHLAVLVCLDNLVAIDEIEKTSEEWTKHVLVVVPVRLGTQNVNEKYYEHIKSLFQIVNCMGIVGGRPKHSLYFVGYAQDTLYYLDPHHTQPYMVLDGTEPESYWHTFHSKHQLSVNISRIDPSLAIAFLVTSQEDCELLVNELTLRGIVEYENFCKTPIFSIVKEKPTYFAQNEESVNEHGFEIL